MKTYKYTVFLRHPVTEAVQHGTFEIDHDDFIDCHTLFNKLQGDVIKESLYEGYTLIAMQVVSVADNGETK